MDTTTHRRTLIDAAVAQAKAVVCDFLLNPEYRGVAGIVGDVHVDPRDDVIGSTISVGRRVPMPDHDDLSPVVLTTIRRDDCSEIRSEAAGEADEVVDDDDDDLIHLVGQAVDGNDGLIEEIEIAVDRYLDGRALGLARD